MERHAQIKVSKDQKMQTDTGEISLVDLVNELYEIMASIKILGASIEVPGEAIDELEKAHGALGSAYKIMHYQYSLWLVGRSKEAK